MRHGINPGMLSDAMGCGEDYCRFQKFIFLFYGQRKMKKQSSQESGDAHAACSSCLRQSPAPEQKMFRLIAVGGFTSDHGTSWHDPTVWLRHTLPEAAPWGYPAAST